MAPPTTILRLIADRYLLGEELGHGSFGVVHIAHDKKRNTKVAIKISENIKNEYIQTEHKMYKVLYRGQGIPKSFWYGKHQNYSILVMELLGKSLDEHFYECNYSFSLKTILMIADQIITIIQFLHKRGLLHRDIKPANFLTGLAHKEHQVFIIDLGLSKFYCDPSTKEHIDFQEHRNGITGTISYLSLNATKGQEPSRRDDLESFAYMLIYFLQGKLPWQGLPLKDKIAQVLWRKKSISVQELCGSHPEEFATFLLYTRNLGFKETPDYRYIKTLFKNLFLSCNYKEDMKFDWSRDADNNDDSSPSSDLSVSMNASIVV